MTHTEDGQDASWVDKADTRCTKVFARKDQAQSEERKTHDQAFDAFRAKNTAWIKGFC